VRLQSTSNLSSGVEHLLDLTDHDLSSNETIKQAIISNTSLAVASPRTVSSESMVDSAKFSMSQARLSCGAGAS